jgi:hypothetical protein
MTSVSRYARARSDSFHVACDMIKFMMHCFSFLRHFLAHWLEYTLYDAVQHFFILTKYSFVHRKHNYQANITIQKEPCTHYALPQNPALAHFRLSPKARLPTCITCISSSTFVHREEVRNVLLRFKVVIRIHVNGDTVHCYTFHENHGYFCFSQTHSSRNENGFSELGGQSSSVEEPGEWAAHWKHISPIYARNFFS